MVWETSLPHKCISGDPNHNGSVDVNKDDCSSQIEWTVFLIYTALLAFILITFICGCLHSLFNSFCKCCKREDNFRLSYMLIFTVYSWEYLCDIMFVALLVIHHYNHSDTITDISGQYAILLIVSLCFLSITYMLNMVFLYFYFECLQDLHPFTKHADIMRADHVYSVHLQQESIPMVPLLFPPPLLHIPLLHHIRKCIHFGSFMEQQPVWTAALFNADQQIRHQLHFRKEVL